MLSSATVWAAWVRSAFSSTIAIGLSMVHCVAINGHQRTSSDLLNQQQNAMRDGTDELRLRRLGTVLDEGSLDLRNNDQHEDKEERQNTDVYRAGETTSRYALCGLS